jgi:hypothetical protein
MAENTPAPRKGYVTPWIPLEGEFDMSQLPEMVPTGYARQYFVRLLAESPTIKQLFGIEDPKEATA